MSAQRCGELRLTVFRRVKRTASFGEQVARIGEGRERGRAACPVVVAHDDAAKLPAASRLLHHGACEDRPGPRTLRLDPFFARIDDGRDGQVVDAQPVRALFGNSYFWHEFVHMYFAGYIVAGFLLASAYAWRFLRGCPDRYERAALTIALSAAAVATPVQIVIGDWAAREVAKAQPVKIAAMEGLARTMTGAPVHVLGWFDGDKVVYGIEIPRLLSLLAFHDASATVQGLDSVPAADRPPVNVVRFAFQTMVGIGTLLAILSAVYLYLRFRYKRLPTSRWFYRAVLTAGPLSVVALIAGWITTEVGRQPWVVYGVMRTSAAVTGAHGIPIGYGTLIVVYLLLAGALAWTLRQLGRAPLDLADSPAPATPRFAPSRSQEVSRAP